MADDPKPQLTFKVETTESKSEPVVTESKQEVKVETSVPVEPVPDKPTLVESVQETLDKISPAKKIAWGRIALIGLVFAAIGSFVWFDGVKHSKNVIDYVWTKDIGIPKKKAESKKEEVPVVKEERRVPKVKEKKAAEVLVARDYYLRMLLNDQTVQVRTGGTLNWRMNNPCSILYGKFAVSQNAIGKASKYAVFETYEAGRKACYVLLFESEHGYKNKNLADAMKRFAPLKEGFKTQKYIDALKKIRVNTATIMVNLPENKRQQMIDMLMEIEDFIPGKVIVFESLEDFDRNGY